MLELDELPKSLIVVGGGYIGLEKACIFNALGVKVDVFIRGEKVECNAQADDDDDGDGGGGGDRESLDIYMYIDIAVFPLHRS